MKRFALAALLALLSGTTHAAVYKWVDADGNVQFGNVPPTDSAQKIMDTPVDAVGEQKKEWTAPHPIEERIIGTWHGMFRGEFLSLEFYERDDFHWGGKNFRLSRVNNVNGRPGNSYTTIFSGYWEMKGKKVLLHRTRIGILSRLYPDYQSLRVVSQTSESIDVIFDNDERFKGVRYTGSGHMPSYMRRH